MSDLPTNTMRMIPTAGIAVTMSNTYCAVQVIHKGVPEHFCSVFTPVNRSLTGKTTNAPNKSIVPMLVQSEMIKPWMKKFVFFWSDSLLLAGRGWL